MSDPRVVVGSVWEDRHGKTFTITRRNARNNGWCYCDGCPDAPRPTTPDDCCWWDDRSFADGTLTYVSGPAASPPKVEPPDWNRWLPPEPLPDTGPKKFREGQVWAAHTPSGYKTVRRISARQDPDGDHCSDSLAGRPGTNWGQDSHAAERAILVQDVGEPRPRDPDVLYGRAPAGPMALVGETWEGLSGRRTFVRTKPGPCYCDDDKSTHERLGASVGYEVCPAHVAACWTRISPAPQQPAPYTTECCYCHGFDDEHGSECPTLATPAVVPEAPTEPAQLPEVRRHDFSNPYCVVRRGFPACAACGLAQVDCRAGGACVPIEGWRKAVERALVIDRDDYQPQPPDTRPIYRPLDLGRWASDPRLVWREAAALARWPRGRR